MLFVVVPLGQKPELVASVVEPLAGAWRQILACKFWIDEQVWVSGESNLHQASAILRHHNELNPSIGELLRVPTLVVHGFDAAVGGCRWIWLNRRLERRQHLCTHRPRTKKNMTRSRHQIRRPKLSCHDCAFLKADGRSRVARTRKCSNRPSYSRNETKLNKTKDFDLRQEHSVVYRNSRLGQWTVLSIWPMMRRARCVIRNSSRRSFVKLLAAAPLLSQIAARDLYAQAATAMGKDPRQNVYTRLGVKTVINCRGTWTYLSGSSSFRKFARPKWRRRITSLTCSSCSAL